MRIRKKDIKKLIIQWATLFSVFFCICIALLLCNMYIVKNDVKEIPNQKYVEINGKPYDYNAFNLYLSDQVNSEESKIPNIGKVKSLIYVGEGNEIDNRIFRLFPNIKCMRIRNCIINDLSIKNDLKNLIELEFSNCVVNDRLSLQSSSIEKLTLDYSEVSGLCVNLPQLRELIVNHMNLTQSFLDSFNSCTNIKRISLIGSTLDSIEMLNNFKNVSTLELLKTTTTGFDKLNEFPQLNEVYLDDWVNRKNIDFMYTHFKNGDMKTRTYFIKKKYTLEVRGFN